jgi:hypothetical protein
VLSRTALCLVLPRTAPRPPLPPGEVPARLRSGHRHATRRRAWTARPAGPVAGHRVAALRAVDRPGRRSPAGALAGLGRRVGRPPPRHLSGPSPSPRCRNCRGVPRRRPRARPACGRGPHHRYGRCRRRNDPQQDPNDPQQDPNGPRHCRNGPRHCRNDLPRYRNGPQCRSNGPQHCSNGPQQDRNDPRRCWNERLRYRNDPPRYRNDPPRYRNGPQHCSNGPQQDRNDPRRCWNERLRYRNDPRRCRSGRPRHCRRFGGRVAVSPLACRYRPGCLGGAGCCPGRSGRAGRFGRPPGRNQSRTHAAARRTGPSNRRPAARARSRPPSAPSQASHAHSHTGARNVKPFRTNGVPIHGRRTEGRYQHGSGPQHEDVRRRPTLPRGPPRSTIGAEELNFRVRNGTGCFPFAMAAETLWRCQVSRPHLGNRTVDACKIYE